jgi:hypothetical protein
MREGSGRVATLMVGSAIALALIAAPLAIDWTGLKIDPKCAEAKGDGGKGGGGGGEGGDKGDKGGKGKGGKGKGDGKGKGTGSSDGDDGDSDNDSDSNDGDGDSDDGSPDDGDGKGKGKGKGGSGTGSADGDDGDSESSDMVEGDDGESDGDPVQSQTATASAAAEDAPAAPAVRVRAATNKSVAARRSATVTIKTIRGLPPQGRSPTAPSGVQISPALSPPQGAVLAVAPCATDAADPICAPVGVQPAAVPAVDIAPPRIDPAAGSVPDAPPDPAQDPAQTQLAYAVPKAGLEPEPRPNIDENIYGLMQVEAVRYVDTTIPILIVQGLVFNMSRTKRPVPPLVAVVSDAEGNEVARWKFYAEAPTLQPGASTGFRSETVDPAPDSTRITVVFAPPEESQVASGEASVQPR